MSSLQHEQILSDLIQFLVNERSCPRDCLIREYAIGTRKISHADLAIIDDRTADIVCIIEVKRMAEMSQERLVAYLRDYVVSFGAAIPVYVACPSESRFDIFILEGTDNLRQVGIESFPSYPELKTIAKTKAKTRGKQEQRNAFNWLNWSCYGLAVLVAVLFLLSLLEILVLQAGELSLLGALIALLLIPHATKIKGLGFEFERDPDQRKQQ